MDEEIFLIDGRPVPELKVVELRKELEQRSLPKSGNKKELVDRLLNYLREERAEQNRQQLHQHSEQQQQQINVSAAPDPPIVGIPDMVAQYLAQQQIQLEAARRDADKHRASTSSTEEQAEEMVQRKNSSSEDIMPQQSASEKNDEITAAESGQPAIAEFIPEEPNTVPKMEKKPDLVGMERDEGQSETDGNNEAEPTYRRSASSSETSTDQEDEEDKKIPTITQDEVEIEEEIFQSDAGNKADEQQYEEQATERVEDDDRQMIEETMEEASAGEFVPDEPHGNEELKSSKETIQSTQAEQIVESSTKPIGGDELDFEQEIEEDNGNSDEDDIEEEEHEEPDDRGRKRRRCSSTPSPTSVSSEQQKSVAKQLQDSQISTTASGGGIAEEQMDEAASNVVDGGLVEVVENKPTSTQSDTAKQEAKEQSSVGGFGAGRRSTATSYGSGGRRRLSAADMEKETTTTMEQQTPQFVEEVTVDGFTRRRAVSPARNEVSRWIHIRGLKRPFTNRGLLELLGKFGTVDSEAFWIDSIKSNCIVTFEKPEEAKLARERLHNVVWPPASDGHLIVEYSSEEKLNRRKADDKLPPLGAMDRKLSDVEGNGGGIYPAMLPSLAPQLMGRSGLGIEGTMMVQQAPGGLGGLTIVVDNRAPDSSGPQVHIQHDKEQIHETETRKRKAEELEKSQNTLDQLFKKTKTQPHLYFLPLSSEEVAKRYKNKSTTTASSSLRPHKSVGHHRGISDRDNHHHHSASSSSGAQKGRNSGRDERRAAESSEHRRGERDRDRDHRERGGGRR